MTTGRLVVAITGASGAIYATRFLDQAARKFDQIYLMLSPQAVQVLNTELDLSVDPGSPTIEQILGWKAPNISLLESKNYYSPPASGSFRHDGMVIVPCSMGTAGRIANGISDDLVTRAADVCLKEKRKLILVVRETPLNLVHLRNLTQLAESGATILPASPGFYFKPQTVEAVADTIVARVLQQLDVDQSLTPQWQFGAEQ